MRTALTLFLAIATCAVAETFVCPEPVGVFDTSAPDKQIGQFEMGTKIEVGNQSEQPGMYHVSYLGKDGKFISGLCRAQDVGKAPKSANDAGPKPVIRTKSSGRKPTSDWLDNYDTAAQYALDEKKLLVMDFTGSDWCGWCIKLDREVFATPEFKNYALDNLILLKLDFPKKTSLAPDVKQQNDRLAQKYGIQGFPTVIVLNSQGQKVGTLGYMEGGPAAFIAELKKLKP